MREGADSKSSSKYPSEMSKVAQISKQMKANIIKLKTYEYPVEIDWGSHIKAAI